ncbi:MAG TPA: Dyp-type peroxidase domain-containing protein, partial [Acidimicrobiales bacterium]|nr:Dyp-type peroxidase domain-containing protein [Acidimicrobiales bacterium]
MSDASAVSRRAVLGGIGAAAVAGAGGFALGHRSAEGSSPGGSGSAVTAAASTVVPFHGAHQAGIATPAQDRLAFASFDVTTSSPAELKAMLAVWTEAARRMTLGL